VTVSGRLFCSAFPTGGVVSETSVADLDAEPSRALIQEVIDVNAEAIGGGYTACVRRDTRRGWCEVRLVLRPVSGWLLWAANYRFGRAQFSQQ